MELNKEQVGDQKQGEKVPDRDHLSYLWHTYAKNHSSVPYTVEAHDNNSNIYHYVRKSYGEETARAMHAHAHAMYKTNIYGLRKKFHVSESNDGLLPKIQNALFGKIINENSYFTGSATEKWKHTGKVRQNKVSKNYHAMNHTGNLSKESFGKKEDALLKSKHVYDGNEIAVTTPTSIRMKHDLVFRGFDSPGSPKRIEHEDYYLPESIDRRLVEARLGANDHKEMGAKRTGSKLAQQGEIFSENPLRAGRAVGEVRKLMRTPLLAKEAQEKLHKHAHDEKLFTSLRLAKHHSPDADIRPIVISRMRELNIRGF